MYGSNFCNFYDIRINTIFNRIIKSTSNSISNNKFTLIKIMGISMYPEDLFGSNLSIAAIIS